MPLEIFEYEEGGFFALQHVHRLEYWDDDGVSVCSVWMNGMSQPIQLRGDKARNFAKYCKVVNNDG